MPKHSGYLNVSLAYRCGGSAGLARKDVPASRFTHSAMAEDT